MNSMFSQVPPIQKEVPKTNSSAAELKKKDDKDKGQSAFGSGGGLFNTGGLFSIGGNQGFSVPQLEETKIK